MKKLNVLLISIIILLSLSGCVESERPSTRRYFVNHTKSYEIIEYSWASEVQVDVKKGYYYAEERSACFDVEIIDIVDEPTYTLIVTHIEDEEDVYEEEISVINNKIFVIISGKFAIQAI